MKDFLFLFLNGGIAGRELDRISHRIHGYNRTAIRRYSSWALLFFTVLTMMSLRIEYMRVYLPAYAGGFGLTLVCWLLQKFGGDGEKVIHACVMLLLFTFLEFGLLTGTVYAPGEPAATYIAMLVLACMIFIVKPIELICLYVICDAQFILLGFHVKEMKILSGDLLNCLAFTAVAGILGGFVMSDRLRRYALEEALDRMSRIDQMTGVKNRNSYEKRIEELKERAAGSLACVYVDANGLHELNNREGHEAGDRMLKSLAEGLLEAFGPGDVYRIGGDEFVVFVLDKAEEEISAKIERFLQQIRTKEYSAAVGMVLSRESERDILGLIKEAEGRMYKHKENYYEWTGQSRR